MSTQRILFICDHLDRRWIEKGTQHPGCVWKVLPLGVTVGRYRRALGNALNQIGATVLDVGPYVDEAEESLRRFYLEFVYHTLRQSYEGSGSILDVLQYNSINLWWLTDASEKSPLRTPFITELYQLALLNRVLADENPTEVWVSMSHSKLAGVLIRGLRERGILVSQRASPKSRGVRAWLNDVGAFSFWIKVVVNRILIALMWIGNRLLLHAAHLSREVADDGRPVALLYSRYPILYTDPFGHEPQERYFRYLVDSLARKAQVWYGVVLSFWPWELWSQRQEIKRVFRTYRMVPLELYNTWLDLARAVFAPGVFVRAWRCAYRVLPRASVTFDGWNILPLWSAEVRRSLSGEELVSNLLLLAAIQRMVTQHHIAAVIHPCEFQPMERAIW